MFCRYCGAKLENEALFCSKCGKSVTGNQTNAGDYTYTWHSHSFVGGHSLVATFSERVKTNAIIWIVIGAIQVLYGLLYGQWFLLFVGVLNLITAGTDLKYAKQVLQSPKGIVARVKPLVGSILTLIYNLVFGGVIGIAGSVYYLVAVRGFVMKNEHGFREIEGNQQE